MAPFQQPRNFKQTHFVPENSQVLEDSKIPMNGIKIIDDFADKDRNILASSELVPHLSLVQCVSENLPQLPSNLTELEISNNNLTQLPDLFKSFSNLTKLSIHNTLLDKLPETIGELKNLHHLNLSHNQLSEIPKSISNLKHLELLNLSHNELVKLPLSYANLQLLRELDLSYNNFQRLPKCIANGMGTLRVLNISDNIYARINIIPHSKYLEKFYAKNNKNCGTFPDWILCSKFFNLKEFNLDNTQFDVYTFNGKEGNLYYTTLSMSSSNLSSAYLDMLIENMINLRVVNVGNEEAQPSGIGNVFNCIPVQTFRNPKLITELNFRATGLGSIPSTINTMCNLRKLDLSLNNISWFPDEFCELQELECLKIDGNHLILLPDDIGNLRSIQEIHAENNSLETLPESFENLKNLRLIDLYDNKIQELPEMLCKVETLQALDLELNYFATTGMKVGNTLYSVLRENFKDKTVVALRSIGAKDDIQSVSDSDSIRQWSIHSSGDEKDNFYVSSVPEENWDTVTDSDDEYEPNSLEINYNQRSKHYLEANLAPLGFCPADLHPQQIRKEVASMRVYGSMPSYRIEEGQFDDA